MNKHTFIEMAEKDMDFEADWVIKDLCNYAEKNLIECDFIFETFLKAFSKKVKAESSEFEMDEVFALAKQNCWISVNDFLPEERENPMTMDYYQYPVTFQNGNVIDVRYYKFGGGHWWHGSQMMDKYVTAWMPIPNPYRAEIEEQTCAT